MLRKDYPLMRENEYTLPSLTELISLHNGLRA